MVRGNVGHDFLADAALRGRVAAELVDGPVHGGGGALVAGGEEGHELVDEVFVGEGAGGDGDGEDVAVGWGTRDLLWGRRLELGFLHVDHLAADVLDGV